MNKNTNSNSNLSPIYNFPKLREYINKLIELKNKSHVNSKEVNKNLQIIIKLSDMKIETNKLNLTLINKNKLNLDLSNSENLNNELDSSILNESNSIVMNERQYIGLISSFNSKLASFTINNYTFTNRPYKQINKFLYNLYVICKSVFLNMSSIISKPIVSINPNLIKITLFFYWKPLKEEYYNSNFNSKFLIFNYNKLEKLVNLLSKSLKRSVELELIRIYSPQNESNILANLLGILSNFIKFRYIHMKLFKLSKIKNLYKGFSNRKNSKKIPSSLSGIYIKLAGRVLTQKIQKRVKSKIVQKGSLARTKAQSININKFVNKNKRGSFSITIKTGHIINN
jgi:Mitochondrial ribosomal protein (VAR1)